MYQNTTSKIFQIKNCPIPKSASNHHEGIDNLLKLMADYDLKFFKTLKDTDLGGPTGFIDCSDVVLLKVNAQWKY